MDKKVKKEYFLNEGSVTAYKENEGDRTNGVTTQLAVGDELTFLTMEYVKDREIEGNEKPVSYWQINCKERDIAFSRILTKPTAEMVENNPVPEGVIDFGTTRNSVFMEDFAKYAGKTLVVAWKGEGTERSVGNRTWTPTAYAFKFKQ